MTLVLEMEIDGVPENVAALMIIARRAGNLEPALRKVIGVWEDIEQQVFSDGVLVDTGHLKESLTITGADGAVRDAHGTEIKFGTTVDYARAAGKKTGHRVLAGPPRNSDQIVLDYLLGMHGGEL